MDLDFTSEKTMLRDSAAELMATDTCTNYLYRVTCLVDEGDKFDLDLGLKGPGQ